MGDRLRATVVAVGLVVCATSVMPAGAIGASVPATTRVASAPSSSAFLSGVDTPAGPGLPTGSAPVPVPAIDPTGALQASLDAQVTRAVSTAGWRVTDVHSTLDPATIASSPSHQAGKGRWALMVEVPDGASFQLDGDLDFELAAETLYGPGSGQSDVDATVHVEGTLGSEAPASQGASIVLTSDQHLRRQGGNATGEGTDLVEVTRGGASSRIRATRSLTSQTLAWDLQRTSELAAVDRDGDQHKAERTTLVRRYPHGQSEVWQHVSADPDAGDASFDMRLHAFLRVRHDVLQAAVDQAQLSLGGRTTELGNPGQLILNADGSGGWDLPFTGPDGPLGTRRSGAGTGVAVTDGAMATRVAMAAYDSRRATPPTTPLTQESTCTAIVGAIAAALLGIALAYLAAPFAVAAAGNPITWAAVSASATEGWGLANIIAGLVAGIAANLLKEKYPGQSGTIDTVAAILGILLGIGLGLPSAAGGAAGDWGTGAVFGGFGGFFGWVLSAAADWIGAQACNGDPWFLYPDVRTGLQLDDPPPGSLLRATGGSIVPDDNLDVPGLGPPVGAGGAPSADDADYGDAAAAFVAGAVPDGATAIGQWTFDPTHAYGAAASHTQEPAPGPHKHAFIHAATPLALAAGDSLVQYVWLDPEATPTELMLQFYTGDGDGEHRAYWGEDLIQTGGGPGTESLFPAGGIPQAGGWVRLKVAAADVGLEGRQVSGVLYGSWDGRTWWGPTTTSSRQADRAPDAVVVAPPTAPAVTTRGAQVAFALTAPAEVTLTIEDAGGILVRTLLDGVPAAAGYHVVAWDGADESGIEVPDAHYTVRLTIGDGPTLSEPITITPFVAAILTPGEMGVVRGNAVPITGSAYGDHFAGYELEVGSGRSPTEWTTILKGAVPVVPAVYAPLRPPSTLAFWDAGLDEFRPFNDPGASGLQTLRLTVTGDDGRQAVDQVPVVVGRLAHSAEPATISSPDGRATLEVPPLATTEPFALLAVVTLADSDPGLAASLRLPPGVTPLGPAWEVLPPDETFRAAATLTLPTTTSGQSGLVSGVLIGDGTADGWHTLDSVADPEHGVVRASVWELGGRRAIVVPAEGSSLPAPSGRRPAAAPTIDAADLAPVIASPSHPAAFSLDFQSGMGEAAAADAFGTGLDLVNGEAAGLQEGDVALQVTHASGGARMLRVSATPWDAARYPLLVFDYRLDPGYAPDVIVRANDHVWVLQTGNGGGVATKYYESWSAPALDDDGGWHHAQIDLLGILRRADPAAESYVVDEVLVGQVRHVAWMQVMPSDSGPIGSSYLIDDVAALRPASATPVDLGLSGPPGVAFDAWSVSVDQERGTRPPPRATTTGATARIGLPSRAADGPWYVHVRGRVPGGAWSPTAHYPLVLDRAPPLTGEPLPADGGAGDPNVVALSVSDATGVDASALVATLAGARAGFGPGVRYDTLTHALTLVRSAFDPPPPPLPTGSLVDVTVSGITDYAGNAAADAAWHFTSDAERVPGDDFHQLTVQGGWSPSLSPDGSRVAFVSDRDGVPRIYVMRADDFSETGGSAIPLTQGSDRQRDPTWSLDGTQIAFASDATGSDQLWVAGADGTGARAVTAGGGGMATPSYAAEGGGIAFVRAGNAWLIDPASGSLRALTEAPDAPYAGLAWQPGGTAVALHFSLYADRIELLDTTSGRIEELTQAGNERDPAWLGRGQLLYTAPSAAGGPSAIWQIGTDGAGATFLGGSGQQGVSDSEADTAPDGGAIVITSTRGGARDVWVRRALEIGHFHVSPPTGAPAGEASTFSWSLPADATVTLDVLGVDGEPARTVLDGQAMSKGEQSATWDGRDGAGSDMAVGTYTARLRAMVTGVPDPIDRILSVAVLDPRDVGSLDVTVEAWKGEAPHGIFTTLSVYLAGTRVTPVAVHGVTDRTSFKLPSGHYDLLATVHGVRRATAANVEVPPGGTASRTIDLGYGGLEVTVLAAPDQPAGDDALVQVVRSSDPARGAVATVFGGHTSLQLPADVYDVRATYQGAESVDYGVVVSVGKFTTRDIDLGSGVVHVAVDAYAGTPAFADQLIVRAYAPDDHEVVIGDSLFKQPADIRLPAGIFDLKISYNGSAPGSSVSVPLERWVNGVRVDPGATTPVDVDLGLSELDLTVVQAAGVPVAQPASVLLRLLPEGSHDVTATVGTLLFADHGTFQVPAGRYQALLDYPGTDFQADGPLSHVYDLAEGVRTTETLDMATGHLRVVAVDRSGQPVDATNMILRLSLPDRPNIITVPFKNPADAYLRAGLTYQPSVTLSGGAMRVWPGPPITMAEGEEREIRISEADFPPAP